MSKEVLDVLLEIAKAVAIVTIPIVARRIDAYLAAKQKEVEMNRANTAFKATERKIWNIIRSAVDTTNQTFVDALKKDNKFDKDAWEQAYKKTYVAIMKQLSADTLDFINVAYGDVDEYIRNQVESYIADGKMA